MRHDCAGLATTADQDGVWSWVAEVLVVCSGVVPFQYPPALERPLLKEVEVPVRDLRRSGETAFVMLNVATTA